MEKLMALYSISSPSGREGKMAKFIIEELKRMEIPFRQDRYGNIYAVKGNRESYPCVVAIMKSPSEAWAATKGGSAFCIISAKRSFIIVSTTFSM